MKTKLVWSAVILSVLILVTSLCSAQTTVSWATDGWIIKDTYTNPNPTVGSPCGTLDGTVTYSVESLPLPNTVDASLQLLAGSSKIIKTWKSKNVLSSSYTISDKTGEGDATFDSSGHLVFTVNAPNDGVAHTFQFKLKATSSNWLVYVPFLRNLVIDKPEMDKVS